MIIIAISDIHGRLERLPALAQASKDADRLVILGDLTQFGHREAAARVLSACRSSFPDVLAVPGNLDFPDVLELLEEENISLHGRHWQQGGVGLAGLGGSGPTPFGTPFELGEDEIYTRLDAAVRAIAAVPIRIVASHAPPKDTAVDRVRLGQHVGSSSVRRIILDHQPQLLLCGHIHEAAGEDHLGATHVINPGPFFAGGYVRIECSSKGMSAELRTLARA